MAGTKVLQKGLKLPIQRISFVLKSHINTNQKYISLTLPPTNFGYQGFSNQSLFSKLQPHGKTLCPQLLLPKSLNSLTSRSFFFKKKPQRERSSRKRVPKLILIQNPFTWLMNKIDFGVLKALWDPSFVEKEFKRGTRQAVSRITQVISDGEYDNLSGLLTKAARISLMRELDRNWGARQRTLLYLHRDDIQITAPRKVHFIKIANKKFCDVDMAFLALKWAPINNVDSLIFTEIFARFHRDYTPHTIPDWTVAYFKVTRFEVLRRRQKR